MANTFKMEERGRQKTRRSLPFNPFISMKSILSRKLRLNRSLSRERSSSPPRFVSGIVEHAHQSEPDNQTQTPPIYLVVHIDLNGSILPPDPSSKFGALVCECSDPLSFKIGKHVTFVTKLPEPQAGKEHYVSSPFVVPEVREGFKTPSHGKCPLGGYPPRGLNGQDFSVKLAKKNLTDKGGYPRKSKNFSPQAAFFGVFHPKNTVFGPKS